MNLEPIRRVADTLLYDGFNVYPHRRPTTGKQRRWRFGSLYPRGYTAWTSSGVSCSQQTQCLVEGPANLELEVCVRFLQGVERTPGAWREAIEREVSVPPCTLDAIGDASIIQLFEFGGGSESEPVCDIFGQVTGTQTRSRFQINGEIIVMAQRLGDACHRLTVRIENLSPFNPAIPWSDDDAALHALGAVHTVVGVRGGRLLSLIDPPAPHRILAAQCVNRGCFPVLVGDRDACDTLLAAPTILPDYPDRATG